VMLGLATRSQPKLLLSEKMSDASYTVLTGNCLEIMQTMEDARFDCTITDPPYQGFDFTHGTPAGYWSAFSRYYDEICRLCSNKQRIAISQPKGRHEIFQSRTARARIASIEDGFEDNRGAGAQFLLWNPVSEEVQSAECWPSDIVPDSIHPNDRNINKMAILVKAMTREGDVVFDPFCGSAAIGVACILLGRSYVGIELLPDRAEDAKTRLAAAMARIRRS